MNIGAAFSVSLIYRIYAMFVVYLSIYLSIYYLSLSISIYLSVSVPYVCMFISSFFSSGTQQATIWSNAREAPCQSLPLQWRLTTFRPARLRESF